MSKKVYNIFASVSRNYDFVNSFFSLGTIILWRRKGAAEAMIDRDMYALLDICTGTGDLALEISRAAARNNKKVSITAADFSPNMLKVAKEKGKRSGSGIKFELGDAMKLKYKNESFDVITSSFGLRNVDNLKKFAEEAYRVMKKGGKFVFMDMAKPDSIPDRLFLKFFWTVMYIPGHLEDRNAYYWLMSSINNFDKKKFVGIVKKAGFKNVKIESLLSGSAFMVTGNK